MNENIKYYRANSDLKGTDEFVEYGPGGMNAFAIKLTVNGRDGLFLNDRASNLLFVGWKDFVSIEWQKHYDRYALFKYIDGKMIFFLAISIDSHTWLMERSYNFLIPLEDELKAGFDYGLL